PARSARLALARRCEQPAHAGEFARTWRSPLAAVDVVSDRISRRKTIRMPSTKRTDPDAKGRTALKSSALQTPLETYLREINETALLTAKDEQELAHLIAL